MRYQPPFTVSPKAISLIAEIAALTERFAIRLEQADALRLRRANRIRTIRASLAIEGNTLTENQVTDILDGKHVVAPLREIQEVKNAIATYDLFAKINPFSQKDLLKAHGTMMLALADAPGEFRKGGVGVFADGKAIHIAPPAERVPALIGNLFDWLENADDHLLIRSCVFHYEFEFIHPFPDGNGRMGRLWQSLVLSRFHPIFQHLPVETMVHDNQWAYYEAINRSTQNTDCGVFIDFMLGEIRDSLLKHKGETFVENAKNDQVCDQATDRVILLLKALKPGEKTSFEARNRLGLRHGPTFRANYLVPALAAGLAEMTQPDSPRSPTQKYRLTDKGRALLASLKTRQASAGIQEKIQIQNRPQSNPCNA
ncbi:MAG: Fic family protein [Opitutaceae bacterium]|nr:Fic family protein [Opitutaceae bacterium]